ncbi:hypothetical protein HD597_011277 [Nonomuraea thailandensis]|uniref:Uncharacterized protein n=1 Tax=Nonomuraea thailandensis TaxID=1188745 RepID=A0A9X2GUU1_9ACTN|nr:hypothetical protein [Nonomuraea thailandensis]MCP2364257.1 hypothetical protein [Nonomuraea thailandensis]
MAATLLVSILVATAAGNAAWWWCRDRRQQACIRSLRRQRDHWRSRAQLAEEAMRTAADKATALEQRNRMLSDLIGEDRT